MNVPDVNCAATLQSRRLYAVMKDRAGSGIELADRGTHELKGVPGEWRLYAVSGTGD